MARKRPYLPEKTINLYNEAEASVWADAEAEVRKRYDLPNVREGTVIGIVLAEHLSKDPRAVGVLDE